MMVSLKLRRRSLVFDGTDMDAITAAMIAEQYWLSEAIRIAA